MNTQEGLIVHHIRANQKLEVFFEEMPFARTTEDVRELGRDFVSDFAQGEFHVRALFR